MPRPGGCKDDASSGRRRTKLLAILISLEASKVSAAALASGPRDRARYHPRGAPPEYGPESARGSRDLVNIKNFVLGGGRGRSACSVLIDGNNARGFAGVDRFGALDLTRSVSKWRVRCDATDGPEISVVWDGGRGPSALLVDDSRAGTDGSPAASAVAALFSGPDSTADDVIVQSCCFLDGIGERIAVFTSDANLGHRCQLQCREADLRVFHSVHLAWILDRSRENQDSGTLSTSARHLAGPDFWERSERRSQVHYLQSALETNEAAADVVERSNAPLKIHQWIDMGRPGLSIGRVTRIGSIMYSMERENFEAKGPEEAGPN